MAPTNPPPMQTRRPSTRIRFPPHSLSSSQIEAKSASPASAATGRTSGRPGRPRKGTSVEDPIPDPDTSRRTRGGRYSKPTREPSTDSSRSSSTPERRSPKTFSTQDMDVDGAGHGDNGDNDAGQDETSSDATPRRENTAGRGISTRSSTDSPRNNNTNNDHSKNTNNKQDSKSLSGRRRQNTNESNNHHASEDRDMEEASSGSDNENRDGESDEDQQGSGSNTKRNNSSSRRPTRRLLRSSKILVPLSLSVDGHDADMGSFLSQYSDEQQLLKTSISAAEALSRLLQDGMQDPDNLHQDITDTPGYELIRHTFGDIEDLNLNLTGTALSAPDESSVEDDDLTKELKREHRSAKKQLTELSKEYKAFKKRGITTQSEELEIEAAQIRAGTHPGLQAELKAIEERRKTKLCVLLARRDYLSRMAENTFDSVCKAAQDQYSAGQMATRKTMTDLVQSRMNSIKQELLQSKRAAAEQEMLGEMDAHGRKLAYLSANGIQTFAYDSCPESCSSYDSFSSSGSDCSDCETCRPERNPRRPTLAPPLGLNRKELAIDLAFLFPKQSSHHHGYSRGYDQEARTGPSLDGNYGEPRKIIHVPPSTRNQLSLIDQLNDERRRKRRVQDRELQNPAASKRHRPNEGDSKPNGVTEGVPTHDGSKPRSDVRIPHRHSATHRVSGPRVNATPPSHRPRFVPGFGPDGVQMPRTSSAQGSGQAPPPQPHPPRAGSTRPVYGSAPHGQSYGSNPQEYRSGVRPHQRYPIADKFGRPWDPTRPGIPRIPGSEKPSHSPTSTSSIPSTAATARQYPYPQPPPQPRPPPSTSTSGLFIPPRSGSGHLRPTGPNPRPGYRPSNLTPSRRPPVEYKPHPILQELEKTKRGPRPRSMMQQSSLPTALAGSAASSSSGNTTTSSSPPAQGSVSAAVRPAPTAAVVPKANTNHATAQPHQQVAGKQ